MLILTLPIVLVETNANGGKELILDEKLLHGPLRNAELGVACSTLSLYHVGVMDSTHDFLLPRLTRSSVCLMNHSIGTIVDCHYLVLCS